MESFDYHGFSAGQKKVLQYAWETIGLTDAEMRCIARKEYPSSVMLLIINFFEENESVQEDAILEFKENYEKYLSQGFDPDQIEVIFDGFNRGLNQKEVEVFAKKQFTDLQMEEIKNGLCYGLSPEEIAGYAKPELSPLRMSFERRKLITEKNN